MKYAGSCFGLLLLTGCTASPTYADAVRCTAIANFVGSESPLAQRAHSAVYGSQPDREFINNALSVSDEAESYAKQNSDKMSLEVDLDINTEGLNVALDVSGGNIGDFDINSAKMIFEDYHNFCDDFF